MGYICDMEELIVSAMMEQLCEDEGGSVETADTKELGEVADILKDLCMAEYYHEGAEAMRSGGTAHSHTSWQGIVDDISSMWDSADAELRVHMKTELQSILDKM